MGKTEKSPPTKSVHEIVQQLDLMAGLSRPAAQTERNLTSQNSQSRAGVQAEPAKPAAPTTKGLKPLQRGGVKRRRVETDSEEESEHTPNRLTRFKGPKKPEDRQCLPTG